MNRHVDSLKVLQLAKLVNTRLKSLLMSVLGTYIILYQRLLPKCYYRLFITIIKLG